MKYSNNSRILPYPCLEEGNFSYIEASYDVMPEFGKNNNEIVINHKINNAGFISGLLDSGDAKYACLVAISATAYRKLDISDQPKQLVSWDEKYISHQPKIQPMIVVMREIVHKFSVEDGVVDMFHGQTVTFPKGARIARAHYMDRMGADSLIDISHDLDVASGNFKVFPVDEDGFYFKARVASDLYAFLSPGGHGDCHGQYRSIMTHIIHACFQCLCESEDYSDKVYNNFVNLRTLESLMRDKNLPCWFEDGFSPGDAAMTLYPHIVSTSEEE